MLINTNRITQQSPKPNTLSLAPEPQAEKSSSDSVTLSGGKNDTLATIAGTLALAGGVAGTIGSGVYAARFLPSGMSGLGGAITGALTGAIAGGATGLALATAATAIQPSDPPGDALLSGLSTMGGTVIGSVAGAISGYFGAQPLIVAPAAITGGLASLATLGAATSLLVGD